MTKLGGHVGPARFRGGIVHRKQPPAQTMLDEENFVRMLNRMRGRPPKAAIDRRTDAMKIPMTDAEKRLVVAAAESVEAKPVTWARDVLLKAARRRRR